MKKILRILTTVLVIILLLSAIASCGSVDDKGDVTVVIENRDGSYTVYVTELEKVENKSEGAVGILEHLGQREENPLSVDVSDGAYGSYINSIGTLTPDAAKNEFISVYTSVESDFGTFEGVGEKSYEGVRLVSSGVGISSMTVTEGCVLLFCIESY